MTSKLTCEKFAAGYAEGASLDAAWANSDEAWALAWPLAYLGNRRDLVPEGELARLDADADAKPQLRRKLIAIVGDAYDYFARFRGGMPQAAAPRAARVGRNDPCPCGSGKKYKRCCEGAAAPPVRANRPLS